MESIDDALSTLGEGVKVSIYFHLEEQFDLKKQEIPERIDDFSKALEKIFMIGARHLEIMFMRCLYSKSRINCELDVHEGTIQDTTFKEYVVLMEKIYEDNVNQTKMEFLIDEEQELQRCKST